MEKKQHYVVFIGSPCIDEYYRMLAAWPKEGDKANAVFTGNVAGGMIANAACVCAGYGVKTYCFDVMGDSDTTGFLLDDMKKKRVDMSQIIRVTGHKDAKCIIFQNGGERTIIVVHGDTYRHTLTPAQLDFLRGASYVFTSLPNLGTFIGYGDILRDLKAHGVKIMFDNEPTTHTPGWEDALCSAHTLFFNEFSLEVFAEGGGEDKLFQKLFDMGVTNIVITLGPLGCRVKTRTDDFSIPAYDMKKVDTTGAGDTYNSTFTVGMLRGWPLKETAMLANAAANMAITVQGPRGGVTTEEKVRQFVADHTSEISPDF